MSTAWTLQDLVDLNSGEPGRPLTLHVPTGLLLDTSRCQMIERQIRGASEGGAWEIVPARAVAASSIPKEPGIYMFVWRPSLTFIRSKPNSPYSPRFVLYIGRAGGEESRQTLHSRFKTYRKYLGSDPQALWSEAHLGKRVDRLSCFLSLEPIEYWFIVCSNAADIREIEARLIAVLNPPINRKREPILKVGNSRSAF